MAANPSVEVVSFEPVPVNASRLRANLVANDWAQHAEVVEMAVTDFTGTTPLHIPLGDHPMSGSLDPAGFRGQAGAVTDSACTSLDDFFATRTPDLVKIDVEGFEHTVLSGMSRLLRDTRPALIVECNPDGPTREVESILRAHEYSFQTLPRSTHHSSDTRHRAGSEGGLSERIVPPELERFRDVEATPLTNTAHSTT